MTVKNKGWTQLIETCCSSISLPHIDRLGSASVFFFVGGSCHQQLSYLILVGREAFSLPKKRAM